MVAFFSTYPRHPISGGRLWIDNVSLEYATGIHPEKIVGSSEVTINFRNDVLSLNCNPENYQVYKSNGTLVLSGGGESDISISALNPGLYILRVLNEGQLHTKKFIRY